jgi:hypothetical protein
MRDFRRKFEDCNDKLADIIRDGETTRSGRRSHDYVYAKDIQDKQTNGPYKLTKNADILKYDYLNYHRKNELWHDNDDSVSVSMNSASKENLIKQIMLTNSDISTHKPTKKPRKFIIRKRNEQQHDEQQHDNYPRKRQKTKADTSKILAGVVNRRRAATLKEQEEAAREEESQKMREELHDAQLQIRAERDVADALRASIDPAQEEDSDNQDEDPASEDSEDGSRGRREVGHRKPRPKIVADDESPPPLPIGLGRRTAELPLGRRSRISRWQGGHAQTHGVPAQRLGQQHHRQVPAKMGDSLPARLQERRRRAGGLARSPPQGRHGLRPIAHQLPPLAEDHGTTTDPAI